MASASPDVLELNGGGLRCQEIAVVERTAEASVSRAARGHGNVCSHRFSSYARDVLFYGVVSAQTEKVVEFFLDVTQPRR